MSVLVWRFICVLTVSSHKQQQFVAVLRKTLLPETKTKDERNSNITEGAIRSRINVKHLYVSIKCQTDMEITNFKIKIRNILQLIKGDCSENYMRIYLTVLVVETIPSDILRLFSSILS